MSYGLSVMGYQFSVIRYPLRASTAETENSKLRTENSPPLPPRPLRAVLQNDPARGQGGANPVGFREIAALACLIARLDLRLDLGREDLGGRGQHAEHAVGRLDRGESGGRALRV